MIQHIEELIRTRKSIRTFEGTAIEPEIKQQIISYMKTGNVGLFGNKVDFYWIDGSAGEYKDVKSYCEEFGGQYSYQRFEKLEKDMNKKYILYDRREGFDELKREQEHLIHTVRKEVIEDLQAARAQGDLSENADYDAARDRQARVEARIRELENIFNNIEIIDVQGGTRVVKLGAQVTIRSRDGFEETYTIVSSVEADPMNGKLSNVTPLAVALMDRMVSDEEIEVEVEPREYIRIIDVK